MPSHNILDDPDRQLVIWADTDFANWRSTGVSKEPWTYDWLSDFDETVCLYNIGACVGTYSIMAAARGASVYAFEPLPVNVEALHRNINANNLQSKVVVFPFALSAMQEVKTFYIAEGYSVIAGYGLLSSDPVTKGLPKNSSIRLPSFRLNDIALPIKRPTHLLIDVEGGEVEVLQGADMLLSGSSIESILVEVQSDTEDEVEEILNGFDFKAIESFAPRNLMKCVLYNREYK